MLNKLLKRCMPWMDKGRWYHIGIKADMIEGALSVTDITYDETMFSSPDITYDETGIAKLHFSDPAINATIIDLKTILHVDAPGYPPYVNLSSKIPVILSSDGLGSYLKVPFMPGTVDVWLFIKTN